MKKQIKLEKVTIENLGCIVREEFEPGEITIISGKNATGKTSRIKAIQAALSGGNHPDMIRKGCDSGLVSVEFDNDMTITRTFRQGMSPKIQLKWGDLTVSRPQKILDDMSESFSLNIVSWLKMSDDEKAKMILQSLPLEFDNGKFQKMLEENNVDAEELKKQVSDLPDAKRQPLHFLNELSDQVFRMRTETNHSIGSIKGFVSTLESSLPAEAETGESWEDERDLREDRLAELKNQREKARESAKTILAEEQRKNDRSYTKKQIEIEQSSNEKIDMFISEIEKVRKLIGEKLQKLNADTAKKKAEAEKGHKAAVETIDIEYEPKIEQATYQHAEAKEKADIEISSEGIKRQLKNQLTDLRTHEKSAKKSTAALAAIKRYRQSLLSDNPIEGLDMVDGRLLVDDIPLANLNTAKMIELWLTVADLKMRNTELRLVLIDDFQALDKAHQKAFRRIAKEKNIQVIAAQVSEGELKNIIKGD